jgi:hypothetical protein
MNVEIGSEAAQFPEKEYISGIFLAVQYFKKIIAEKDFDWGRQSTRGQSFLGGKKQRRRPKRLSFFHLFILWTVGILPNLSSYEDAGEDREAIRKKEVEDLISKYAKKKDKEEVTIRH